MNNQKIEEMLRYEFRGQHKDTQKWYFGSLLDGEDNIFIRDRIRDKEHGYLTHPVIPETIGQFTGKKDIKDTPIYEGDIFKFKCMEELNKSIELIGSFCWNDQDLCYEIDIYSPEHPEYVCLNYIDNGQMYHFEIIGNKYDNPELLR